MESRSRVGRQREGKQQGCFSWSRFPCLRFILGAGVLSPSKEDELHQPQPNKPVGGRQLPVKLPCPFLSRHECAALLGTIPGCCLIQTHPSVYFWELAHPQERGWQQGQAHRALLLVSDGLLVLQITICRNDECVLEDNSQRTKWKVISPTGNEAMVPSVCFLIPPPNKEAIEMANR